MPFDLRHVLDTALFAVLCGFLFAAVAVSGRFSRSLAGIFLFMAWAAGMLGDLTRQDQEVSHRVEAGVLLTLIIATLAWWIYRPGQNVKLRIKDIQVTHLPTRPSEMLMLTVSIENLSGRAVEMRNIVWAQTRALPTSLLEEKDAENELWQIVMKGVKSSGRNAQIPAFGESPNQVFESSPFGVSEFRDFVMGTHAVYFAAVYQSRRLKTNLLETSFFVGRDGIVRYCSQHNRP
jgi:hypothetical protein